MWNAADLAVDEPREGNKLHLIIVFKGDTGEGDKQDYVLPSPVDVRQLAREGIAFRNSRDTTVKLPLGAIDVSDSPAVSQTDQQHWAIAFGSLRRLLEWQAVIGEGKLVALDQAIDALRQVVQVSGVDESYVALL